MWTTKLARLRIGVALYAVGAIAWTVNAIVGETALDWVVAVIWVVAAGVFILRWQRLQAAKRPKRL